MSDEQNTIRLLYLMDHHPDQMEHFHQQVKGQEYMEPYMQLFFALYEHEVIRYDLQFVQCPR